MNIILTGTMGAGSAAVGKILSNKLGLSFIDMDEYIEKKQGLSIPEIFNSHGERYFKKAEQDASRELSLKKNHVIATREKSLLNKRNLEKLSSSGLIFTLLYQKDRLCQTDRVYESRKVQHQDKLSRDLEDFQKRKSDYLNLPNGIDTTELSIVQVVKKIIENLHGEEYRISLEIKGKESIIIMKRGLFSRIEQYLKNVPFDGRVFILSDKTVFSLYGEKLLSYLEKAVENPSILILPPGEKSKNLKNLEKIYDWLYKHGASRSSLFLCFGGGMISDLGGLAASNYRWGMPLVNVPTTLMGQIDAGIRGKNSINFKEGINQIGSFYFPDKVLIDPIFLSNLSIKQMRRGLVEALRVGIIEDRELFRIIKDKPKKLLLKDLFLLDEVIKRALESKVKVISLDPWERRQRKTLNLGHTFAHALESLYGYKKLGQGEAEGLGLLCAVKMGILLKMTPQEILNDIKTILRQWSAPLKVKSLDAARALSLMSYDKMGKGTSKTFILPLKIGNVVIKDEIDDKIVLESLKEIIEYEKNIGC